MVMGLVVGFTAVVDDVECTNLGEFAAVSGIMNPVPSS